MTKKSQKLILVDGNALIHRAFHAIPPLTTKSGELVNAVYGFTTTLLKAIKELSPTHIAIAFDLAGPTFRHKEYKEYKATRVKADQALYDQIPRIKEVAQALNIPIFAKEGFEADDIIGTLAAQAASQNIATTIVTGDLDTLQLVNHLVKVYTMKRSLSDTVIYDIDAVKERYQLTPEQFIDYKALRGDPSDNIPGVPGIGEKGAINLLIKYGSIPEIYKHLHELPERTGQSLKDNKEQLELSKKLVTIVSDVPIELDLPKASLKDYDRTATVKLFQELEFKSLLSRLPEASTTVTTQTDLFTTPQTAPQLVKTLTFNHHIVTTVTDLDKLISKIKSAKKLAIDTESEYLAGPLIGISIAFDKNDAYYIPFDHKNTKTPLIPINTVLDKLRPILEDIHLPKGGHNIKYDYTLLRRYNITISPVAFDTMIASYILNPASNSHSLDNVTFIELGHEKIPLTSLIGAKKDGNLAHAPLEKVAEYSCEDAHCTYLLWEKFDKSLAENNLKALVYDLEMPLTKILADMEINGIKININHLHHLEKTLKSRLSALEKSIYKDCGLEFNIASPKQLAEVLFGKLKISKTDIRKGKTGISTAAGELDKLKDTHPVISKIMEHRELSKLLNTYIEALPRLVAEDGRIHTSFNQHITSTGRLSSSKPNLQNIPIRTELGQEIRRAFIADEGYALLSADYSQIELRVIAELAKDKAMLDAFKAGRDIHTETSKKLGIDRRMAKIVNFSIIYGTSAFGLAQALEIDQHEAKKLIDEYFTAFPAVSQYMTSIIAEAKQSGFVETLLGRRRYFPEIHSSSFQVRSAAERAAINMPVQGCLPWDTKILTNEGYIPIGELYERKEVIPDRIWDGTSWQKYRVLNRGEARLAKIHFSNGQILNCDTRHEVLIIDDNGYRFERFSNLQPWTKVCFSYPTEHEFVSESLPSFSHKPKIHNGLSLSLDEYTPELWYWVGYYYGDGHLTNNQQEGRFHLQYTFGVKEAQKKQLCNEYFSSLGLNPSLRRSSGISPSGTIGVKEEVKIHSIACVKLFESLGIYSNQTAHTKRLTKRIFQENLENRKAFVRGLMESDGYVGSNTRSVPNIHLCQHSLLEDIQVLLRTIGIESRIIGPSYHKERKSFRLDIKRRDLSKIMPSIIKSSYTRDNSHSLPEFLKILVKKELPNLRRNNFSSWSDYVIYRRILNGGSTSIYHLKEWLMRNDLHLSSPIYTWHEVVSTEIKDEYAPTFTLSVDSPLHRFDSEGVISKNTAADIMKLAMIKIAKYLENSKSRLLLQVHDELVLEVPEKDIKIIAKEVKSLLESAYKLSIPLVAEVKSGQNWQDMNTISI